VLARNLGVRGRDLTTLAGAVLTGQLSIGWSNDLIDRRRDEEAGRERKPLVSGSIRRSTVTAATGVSVAACVGLSLAAGPRPGVLHLAGVAGGWAYNAGLKRTPLSPLPYAVSFALLPQFIVGVAGRTAPGWLPAAGSLLGSGAHFLNALPDIAGDRETGVRSLAVTVGPDRSRAAGSLLLLSAGAVIVTANRRRLGAGDIAALAAVGGLSFAAATMGGPDSRLPFRLAIAAAAIDVLLLGARSRSFPPSDAGVEHG
jgi:4-hydroxybenzoate polyprenyltransferase